MYVYCFEVEITTIKSKPSISRLELEAAVIATRLKNTIVKRFLLKRGTHFYRQIRKECSVISTIVIPILGQI